MRKILTVCIFSTILGLVIDGAYPAIPSTVS